MSVYDITEDRLGRFDVVFFFGTLYHLRYLLLGLDRLAAVCDSEIYVESAVLDHYSPYQGGFGKGYTGGQIVMEFFPGAQYSANETNWWIPTVHCLVGMVMAVGLDDVDGWKLTNEVPKKVSHCRGFARGRRKAPPG
jgi:tRNA (mo5U34)-methyltransferase